MHNNHRTQKMRWGLYNFVEKENIKFKNQEMNLK